MLFRSVWTCSLTRFVWHSILFRSWIACIGLPLLLIVSFFEGCYNLSQMGELCRIVDAAFAECHPEIPWREMNGLRNRIVHDYEGVNLRLVWEIISGDIPSLRNILKALL